MGQNGVQLQNMHYPNSQSLSDPSFYGGARILSDCERNGHGSLCGNIGKPVFSDEEVLPSLLFLGLCRIKAANQPLTTANSALPFQKLTDRSNARQKNIETDKTYVRECSSIYCKGKNPVLPATFHN